MLTFETSLWDRGYNRIAGVDEAGRGPLAGPVVAAAVVLPPKIRIPDIRDSKRLSPRKREALYGKITEAALGYGIGIVENHVIDEINILEAAKRAMLQSLEGLEDIFPSASPDYVLIDAVPLPSLSMKQEAIIKGDSLSQSIAAASILAKVTRDRIMADHHLRYPQYNFLSNKGYGTREHLEAIRVHGPSRIHRRTFRGVKEFLHRL